MERSKLTLLLMVGLAMPAATVMANTTWTGGGDGTSWSDPANWGGVAPNGQQRVFINGTATVNIAPSVNDQFSRLILADGANTDDVTVNMMGGTININSDTTPGDSNNLEVATVGHATFHMFDGTVNMALHLRIGTDPPPWAPVGKLIIDGGTMNVANRMFVGFATSSIASVEMNGGVLNAGQLFLADGVGSKGTLHMTGGTINTADLWVPTNTDAVGAKAHVQLDGGTINVSHLFSLTNDVPNGTVGTMDITNGKMILAGDLTGDPTLLGYISGGLLTGFGGAGTVLVNYDAAVGTIVSAIPEPATLLLIGLGGLGLMRRRNVH